MKINEILKWMGLLAWILLYRMFEECHTPQSLESLFLSNGIGFCEFDDFNILQQDIDSENYGSHLDDIYATRANHKRKRKSNKKRKRSSARILHDDELLDLDDSINRLKMQNSAGTWLLSTDRYSSSWSSIMKSLQLANSAVLKGKCGSIFKLLLGASPAAPDSQWTRAVST
ncbi:hypothetical protein AKJ16_DCAP06291 [Drosera capensis]